MLNRQAIEVAVAAMVIENLGSGNHLHRLEGAVRLFVTLARTNGVAKGYGWTTSAGAVVDVVQLRTAGRITLAAMKGFEQLPFIAYPRKLR